MNISNIYEIIYLIVIILIIYSLNEIDKSNCECGKKHRKLIKEWFIFILLFKILFLFLFFIVIATSPFKIEALSGIFVFFFIVYLLISLTTIVMEIRLLVFLNEMRKSCDCAFKIKEKILFWFYLIYFALLILSLVIIIPLIIIGFRFLFK